MAKNRTVQATSFLTVMNDPLMVESAPAFRCPAAHILLSCLWGRTLVAAGRTLLARLFQRPGVVLFPGIGVRAVLRPGGNRQGDGKEKTDGRDDPFLPGRGGDKDDGRDESRKRKKEQSAVR